MGLDRMIAPLTRDAFVDGYWERKSLLLQGDADRFTDLFSLEEIGRLLHFSKPKPPEGMLLVKGSEHYGKRWTNADGTPEPRHVRTALAEGYSMIVNGIDKMWEPIQQFTHAVQADLHHPADVNLFVTPPGTQAFSYHWDIMDVFVLQIQGTKHWQVYDAAIDRPFPDEHRPTDPKSMPPMVFEEVLQPGSMLYLPRGHVHAARTTDTTSVHLSVGVHPKTWIDLFASAVQAARNDPKFRSALPPGYLNSTQIPETFNALAQALPGVLDAEFALGKLAEDFLAQGPPPSDDFMAATDEIGARTRLRLRDGVIARVLQGPGYAGIQYSGGKIIGPAKIGAALEAMLAKREFVVGDLTDTLSDKELLVLARRLLKDQMLCVVPDRAAQTDA